MYTLNELDKMDKAELIDLIIELQQTRTKKSNKKYAVLEILKQGPMEILEIANKLDISTKNVSSLLTYLRQQDNIKIHTDDKGRKYIVE